MEGDDVMAIYHKLTTKHRETGLTINIPRWLIICFFYCSLFQGITTVSADVHPDLVESHITNLDLVHEISKFRSGAGHDFTYFREELPEEAVEAIGDIDNFFATDQSEPPSSMKHYYSPYALHKQEHGDNTTIPIYAPFNGTITRVTEEVREADPAIVNKRVEITSRSNANYIAVLFHINLDNAFPQIFNDYPSIPGIWTHQNDDEAYSTRTVQAGDFLGHADMRLSNDFDVAVLFNDTDDDRWISPFDLMPDSLFSAYEARGVDRADTSLSKTYRQSYPVTWWGMRNDDDWLTLNVVPEPATLWAYTIIAIMVGRRRQPLNNSWSGNRSKGTLVRGPAAIDKKGCTSNIT